MYKRMVINEVVTFKNIDEVVSGNLKDQIKQYESINTSLYKVIVLLNSLYGGVINLGLICHPNNFAKLDYLILFIDSLICYGSGYMEIKNPYKSHSLKE